MMRVYPLHEKLLTWEVVAIALGTALFPIVAMSPVVTVDNSISAMATSAQKVAPRTCLDAPDKLHRQACQQGYIIITPISRLNIPTSSITKRLTIAGVVCFANADRLQCVMGAQPSSTSRNLLTSI